jgi:DNA-binding transcriptional MocR family regulator
MSIRAMVWALDAPIAEHSAKLVLIALADHADDKTMQCWPAADHIAKRTGMSRATVYRAISYLRTNGFLEHTKRRHTSGVPRQPLFILNMPVPNLIVRQPNLIQSVPNLTGETVVEPSLNRHKERKGMNGDLKKQEQGHFPTLPHSPEFLSWKSYFTDSKNLSMVRELSQRELEGRPFDFETQWPPKEENKRREKTA